MASADLNINVGVTPKNIFGNISSQITALKGDLADVGGTFKSTIGAFAAAAAAVGTFDFIVDAVRQTEDLTKQFVRFTGSVEEAEKQLDALTKIPGPSLDELAEANRTLLAFGSTTKGSIEELKRLNDVAAANGAKIGELAEIYGKIQQEGTLTAEAFKKLSKEIPGFATDFATALGVPIPALRRLAEEGKITSDQVAEAFKKLTDVGGKYFGSAESQATTLTGALSALKDNFTLLASTIGKSSNPLLISFIDLLARAAEGNARANQELERLANENEAQKRIRAIGSEIEDLNTQLTELQKTQKKGFQFFGDDALKVASDVDAVSTAIRELSLERLKLSKQEGISDASKKEAEAQIENDKKLAKERDRLATEALERKKKLDEIENKAIDDRTNKIIEAEKNIASLELQQSSAKEALRQAEADKAKASREQNSNVELAQQADLEQKITIQKIEALAQRNSQLLTAMAEAKAVEAELLMNFDEAERIRNEDKQRVLTETQRKGETDRQAIIKKAKDEEFNLDARARNARVKAEQQTWQENAAMASEGLGNIAMLMRGGSKDAFNIGRAAALAQALIAIPSIAIKTFDSLVAFVGPAGAAVGAGLAVAAQAIHLNAIRTAQPPHFAEGGMVPGFGNKDNVPALLTPGEVVVPKQNWEQLVQGLSMGSVSNDQVQLLTQSNSLQAKMLEQITQGVIIEKITVIIGLLGDIKQTASFGGHRELPIDAIPTVAVDVPAAAVGRTGERRDLKQVDDRRN